LPGADGTALGGVLWRGSPASKSEDEPGSKERAWARVAYRAGDRYVSPNGKMLVRATVTNPSPRAWVAEFDSLEWEFTPDG
jgi:hypothetical protein